MAMDRDGQLSTHEQKIFADIERGLKKDPEALGIAEQAKRHNKFANRERNLAWRMVMFPAGILAATGLVLAYQVENNKDTAVQENRRTAKAVEHVLESPEDLARLGICSTELLAQDQFFGAVSSQKSAEFIRDHQGKPDGSLYKKAAQQPGSSSLPCSPVHPQSAALVNVDGVDVVITPADVTDFSVDNWCETRDISDYAARAIGDAMMQEIGKPCTDISVPLPTIPAR